ncbi:MAG: T9SS type A sorting domain-containing protein, partial [candidate division WOR-3 bacterium]
RQLGVHTDAARDSFAYMHFSVSLLDLRVIDVTDPRNPVSAGGYNAPNWPEDMVLRDTLLYVAEGYRFEVLNVARPREPELVGSCVSTDGNYFGLAVQDTFAYEVSLYGLWVINVARPVSPFVVSSNVGRNAAGVAVRDTFVYLPAAYDTLWVYSVANPASPRIVGFAPLLTHSSDVALADSQAVVSTSSGLELFNLAEPARPRRVGTATTPYGPRRVVYSAPYFYAAMWDAGVGICAVESVGVSEGDRMTAEQPSGLSVRPNPAHEACVLAAGNRSIEQVTVRDVAGRAVMKQSVEPAIERRQLRLDLSHIRSGVYFIEVDTGSKVTGMKLVKQ